MSNSRASQSLSGLRTVKRDFTENTIATSSTSYSQGSSRAEPIEIDQTPPVPSKLTGAQLRLKAIQDALRGNTTVTSTKTAQPLTHSRSFNKRPSDPAMFVDDHEPAPPQKKKRELPPSWNEPKRSSSELIMKKSGSAKPQIKDVRSSGSHSKKPGVVLLSQEQTQILKLVEDGTSVFYTGSAGTGKSVLLREIIKCLRKRYSKINDAVAITASTGIAACNIGGVTIHSFAGIGLGQDPAPALISRVKKNKKASNRWMRTKVLIIDEVSMLDGDLFDKLAAIGSALRKNPRPFGGIQVIVTGDFFQLPPVTKSAGSLKFAFEAKMWSESIQRTFNLTKVWRQKDPEFVDMLNEMRFGRLTPKSIARFKSLSREIRYDDGMGPTELFPRREDVDRSNGARLNSLINEKQMVYKAHDSGTQDLAQRERLLNNFMAQPTLILRVNAQVMLIKNIDETLVNGSIGKVVRFCDPVSYVAETEVEGSRVTSTNPTKPPSAGPTTTARLQQELPVVAFTLPDGYTTREMLVTPESFKVELPDGEIQAARSQLPLVLAWAMSIHKSQGQTLPKVKVDLGKVFEKGQAYVALSRATSLDGLQVLNFNAAKVQAHPKVVEWSHTLETISFDDCDDDQASWTL